MDLPSAMPTTPLAGGERQAQPPITLTAGMNCDDVRNGIYVYLDGEFAPPEEVAFERHIDACPGCRAMVCCESEFLSALRTSMDAPVASEALRARICDALAHCATTAREDDRAPQALVVAAGGGWRRAVMPTAVAASLTAAVVWSMGAVADADKAPEVVDEAVAVHVKDLPMEVRGTEHQIREFLQENVPFAIQLPFRDEPNVRLVGARLTQLNGRSAVLFNYEYHGERLSVLQLAQPEGDGAFDRAGFQVEDRQGYRVVTYRHRGVTNSVVGHVGESEMLRLVPAGFSPR